MVILKGKHPALYAVDEWIVGMNYTARFVIYKEGSSVPEDFTDWGALAIGVEGEGVAGPNTSLAAVRFDMDAGGAAAGAFHVSLFERALTLGRADGEHVSQILYTVKARRNNFEDRIVANVRVNVLESALI